MPLKPEHLPSVVAFFSSPAWEDLRSIVEARKPDYPMDSMDALTSTAKFRRREGFELCLDTLIRESGVTPTVIATDPTGDPLQTAMAELQREGQFIDTAKD
jgi:hypothetical protein